MQLCTPCQIVAEASGVFHTVLPGVPIAKQTASDEHLIPSTSAQSKIHQALRHLILNNSLTAIQHLQLIQKRCEKCDGSGLVERGPFLRKCPECGGFFPWQGWKQFLTSTAAPGNGGVLRQPRNQEGVIYRYHVSLLQ